MNDLVENPHQYLDYLCRICGYKLGEKGNREVKAYIKRLSNCYGEMSRSLAVQVPTKFCDTCYRFMTNYETRGYGSTGRENINWVSHNDENCETCSWIEKVQRGGRRKKNKPRKSRSLRKIVETAPKDVAQQDLAMEIFDEDINPNVAACQCPICKNLVRSPLMITKCQHIFCAECLYKALSSKLKCAVCMADVHPADGDIQPAQLAFAIVCNLVVFCTCGEKVKLQFLADHRQQCSRQPAGPVRVCPRRATPTPLFYHPENNPTARDILSMQPGEAIPPVVEQVLTHGVKLKMAETPNATYLDLRTDGPQVN